jgi:hypothetical protein
MSLSQLISHPVFFPFNIRIDLTLLRRNERLRVHRQGDQTDFVELEHRPASKEERIGKKNEPKSKGIEGQISLFPMSQKGLVKK